MRGYPKTLNTKFDYLYVRDNFPKEFWEKDFKALLDTQYEWFNKGELKEGEVGIEDLSHKVITDENTGRKSQYSLELNPNCKLLSLGFTESEVKDYLYN